MQLSMREEDMKELLDRIIEAKYKENSFFYDNPIRPKPGGPANGDDLRQLDLYLAAKGLTAPKAYRLFLSVYNGIEHVLGPSYSLLPVGAVIGEQYDILEENIEEFPNYCEFVIAAGNTPNFIGFDINTSSAEGGYEVVEVAADGGEWRLKNFEDFLISYLAVLERNILAQEKDRENLDD
jgi:hypothetical protein